MSSYYSFAAIQIRSNIIGLKAYLKNATGENSDKINEVIKLYEERKIINIKTALNTVVALASNNTNTINSGKPLRLYNQVIDKYGNALPVTGRRTRVRNIQQPVDDTPPPSPEPPIIIEDIDDIEVKPQTYTNRGLFCIDSDTDSTRDETDYEYPKESYTHEKTCN